MSGRGVGVAAALFAAVDAAPKIWEEGGLWRRRLPVRLYRWRRSLQAAAALSLVAAAILAIPLLVIASGLIVYPMSFFVQMVDADAGHRVAMAYSALVARAFEPPALPTLIPRLTTFAVCAAFAAHAVAALDSFRLAGLFPLVTIGGSMVAALAVLEKATAPDEAWHAISIDSWTLRGARRPGWLIFARRCGSSSGDRPTRMHRHRAS